MSLQSVLCYEYLGVHITDKVLWKTRIDFIVNNANSMLAFLRSSVSLAATNSKLQLSKSLVRPKLEYAAFMWDPCQGNNISVIERAQNRYIHFILSN